MDYATYQALNGALDSVEFDAIAPKVEILFDALLATMLPYWQLANLVNYEISYDELYVLEIDYIASVGGESALNGESDLNIKEVTTAAFKVSRGGSNVSNFNGIPLHPLLITLLKKKLRENGLLNRGMVC